MSTTADRLRIAIRDQQNKSFYLGAGLRSCGHDLVATARADVLIIDFDGPWTHRRARDIDECLSWGGTVLVYQHGAQPTLSYDGCTLADLRVTAHLVQAPGVEEVYRRIGLPVPVQVIGWFYCPLQPFAVPTKVRKVLFGPRHPLGDGKTFEVDLRANRHIFEQLVKIPNLEITVQMFGTCEQNGLWEAPGVRFVASDLNLSHAAIDEADLVIGDATFGYLAVARGKPVVMPGWHELPYPNNSLVPLAHWDDYRDYIHYPYDSFEGRLEDVMAAACRGGPELDRWKYLFIGEPLDLNDLSNLVVRLHLASKTA